MIRQTSFHNVQTVDVIAKGVPVIVATKVYNGRALPVYGYVTRAAEGFTMD